MSKINLVTIFFLFNCNITFAQWQKLGSNSDLIFPGGPSTKLSFNSQNQLLAFPSKVDSNSNIGVVNWNGSNWNKVIELKAEEFYSNFSNTFYASIGTDTFCGIPFYHQIIKWNSINFDTLSLLNANGVIKNIYELSNGNLIVSGGFTDSDKVLIGPCLLAQYGVEYVAEWNGIFWDTLGVGVNRKIHAQGLRCFTRDYLGNLYASGNAVDSTGSRFVVKWDGSNWSKVGNISAFGGPILALTCDNNNNIYACGDFWDGALQHNVRKWDGTSWSTLGQGGNELNADGTISVMVSDKQNNIYVAGVFGNGLNHYVAKWDGNSWSNLGNLQANGDINSMAIDSNDNLYCTGWFKDSLGQYYIAKYTLNPTSISTPLEEIAVEIFPNPVLGALKLRMNLCQSEIIKIKIIDILGDGVFDRTYRYSSNEIISIPIEYFKKGIYILKIASDKFEISRKVLIEK